MIERLPAFKPLSWLTAFTAAATILYVGFQLIQQNIYIEQLNFVDGTTLIMTALLMLRSVIKLNKDSDLQTVSLALIVSLSFIFGFEAIYKWSFYFFPWQMPPEELREFLLQAATGLVILSGFAQGKLRITRGSLIAAAVFIGLWILWLALGFPQLWDGQVQYVPLLSVPLTWDMIYYLNRGVKFAFFLIYYFLYP